MEQWPFVGPGRATSSVGSPRPAEEGIQAYEPPEQRWEEVALQLATAAPSATHEFEADAVPSAVLASLDARGFALLRSAGTGADCAALAVALAPAVATQHDGVVGGVVARSPASFPLVAAPCVMELCSAALGRQVLRVPSAAELELRMAMPGSFTNGPTGFQQFRQCPWELHFAHTTPNAPQPLRRRAVRGADFAPATSDLENQLTVWWALGGGAPVRVRVVAGSHRWPAQRTPGPAAQTSSTVIELQPGDALICSSGLTCAAAGGGLGIEVGYQTSFWAQGADGGRTENQQLVATAAMAMTMPEHIRRLCGWGKPGAILNKIYSGGAASDILGAARFLGERPLDWAGHAWGQGTACPPPVTMEDLAQGGGAGSCVWAGPRTFSKLPWEEYPTRFGQLEGGTGGNEQGLTTIEWRGGVDAVGVVERCLAVMARDGAVILAHAVPENVVDAYMDAMQPYNDEDPSDGAGAGCSLARTHTALPLVAHPAVMGVCEGVLGRQVLTMSQPELRQRLQQASATASGGGQGGTTTRLPWQLQVQAFISKSPGGKAQLLHRDGEYAVVELPASQIEHEVSVIWAMHDFTAERGATRVVPGSGHWPRSRVPRVEEGAPAVMPKGSCVLYAGHTLHGAGPNTSDELRVAMNFDYIVGFVKAECNMAAENPPSIAVHYPEELLELAGYHSRAQVEEALRGIAGGAVFAPSYTVDGGRASL